MRIKKVWPLIAMLLLGAVLTPFVSSCGGDSPGDVALESLEAYNQRDFGLVYDLSSSSLRNEIGDRETAINLMESSWPAGAEIMDAKIVDESIDGDNAVVTWNGTVRLPGMEDDNSDSTIHLVREEGQWRLAGN